MYKSYFGLPLSHLGDIFRCFIQGTVPSLTGLFCVHYGAVGGGLLGGLDVGTVELRSHEDKTHFIWKIVRAGHKNCIKDLLMYLYCASCEPALLFFNSRKNLQLLSDDSENRCVGLNSRLCFLSFSACTGTCLCVCMYARYESACLKKASCQQDFLCWIQILMYCLYSNTFVLNYWQESGLWKTSFKLDAF